MQADWPQFQYGPDHRGYNPKENVLSVANVGEMQMLWRATTQWSFGPPVVANGAVYTGNEYSELYAFDALTGDPIWSWTAFGGLTLPAVADGKVFVGTQGGGVGTSVRN